MLVRLLSALCFAWGGGMVAALLVVAVAGDYPCSTMLKEFRWAYLSALVCFVVALLLGGRHVP